jgi:hypothetical protein
MGNQIYKPRYSERFINILPIIGVAQLLVAVAFGNDAQLVLLIGHIVILLFFTVISVSTVSHVYIQVSRYRKSATQWDLFALTGITGRSLVMRTLTRVSAQHASAMLGVMVAFVCTFASLFLIRFHPAESLMSDSRSAEHLIEAIVLAIPSGLFALFHFGFVASCSLYAAMTSKLPLQHIAGIVQKYMLIVVINATIIVIIAAFNAQLATSQVNLADNPRWFLSDEYRILMETLLVTPTLSLDGGIISTWMTLPPSLGADEVGDKVLQIVFRLSITTFIYALWIVLLFVLSCRSASAQGLLTAHE